eukprot:gene13926-biopygen9568
MGPGRWRRKHGRHGRRRICRRRGTRGRHRKTWQSDGARGRHGRAAKDAEAMLKWLRRGTFALDAGGGRNHFLSWNEANHKGFKAFLGFLRISLACLDGLLRPLSAEYAEDADDVESCGEVRKAAEGCGRPRKAVEDAEGRGRPRKMRKAAEGRGRPRKMRKAAEGRGRLRKMRKAAEGRGRPRKAAEVGRRLWKIAECSRIDDSHPQKLLPEWYPMASISGTQWRLSVVPNGVYQWYPMASISGLEDALRALDEVEDDRRLLKTTAHPRRCCGP